MDGEKARVGMKTGVGLCVAVGDGVLDSVGDREIGGVGVDGRVKQGPRSSKGKNEMNVFVLTFSTVTRYEDAGNSPSRTQWNKR
jgi:hypothetical protein